MTCPGYRFLSTATWFQALRSTSMGSPHTGRNTSTDGYHSGSHPATIRLCSARSKLRLIPSTTRESRKVMMPNSANGA